MNKSKLSSKPYFPDVQLLEKRLLLAAAEAGSPFRVNSHATGLQSNPVIAMNRDGSFVSAWQSYGEDGSDWGIFAQRFAPDGSKLGGEVLVNGNTKGAQTDPAVATDGQGNFVIAWHDLNANGIYSRQYDASGNKRGGQFRVSRQIDLPLGKPAVAAAADGGFVIAWSIAVYNETLSDVLARRYDPSAHALGGELPVNQTSGGVRDDVCAAMNSAGDFTIAWSQPGSTGAGSGIYARRFAASGKPKEPNFIVDEFLPSSDPENDGSNETLSSPSIGMDDQGSFVVVWEDRVQDPLEGDYFHVVEGKLFNSKRIGIDLGTIGSFFDNSRGDFSSVAMNGHGDFVVAWAKYDEEIHFSEYTHAAQLGGSGQITIAGSSSNSRPVAGIDPAGNFVLAWTADDTTGGTDVFAAIQTSQNPFATLDNGQLLIRGTQDNDQISLSLKGKKLAVLRNGLGFSFKLSAIKRIAVQAGDGDDEITVDGQIIGANLSGEAGNDTIVGGSGNDTAHGGDGIDRINGVGGMDRLYGDEGEDLLDGGDGRDRLSGGADDDTLRGGNLSDTLYGDSGNDFLDGENHNDRLYGGTGMDQILGGNGYDFVNTADATQDRVNGGIGRDSLRGDFIDLIEAIEQIL